MSQPDRMTEQLMYLPAIIGKMGINIAEAQQALNADYIHTLQAVFELLRQYSHAKKDGSGINKTEINEDVAAQLNTLLPALAPSPRTLSHQGG